jgi:hypothetical protein
MLRRFFVQKAAVCAVARNGRTEGQGEPYGRKVTKVSGNTTIFAAGPSGRMGLRLIDDCKEPAR